MTCGETAVLGVEELEPEPLDIEEAELGVMERFQEGGSRMQRSPAAQHG